MLQSATIDRSIHLSKTDFTNYRRCAGFSWISWHRPHLVPGDTDPGAIRREQAGDEVRLIARGLFPDGVPIESEDMVEAVELTAAAIAAGATTLFQATVRTGRGLLAQADVLTRDGDRWTIHEVKATTSIKGDHITDATFQAIAFAEAGFDIAGTRLILLQKAYRRSGEPKPDRMLVSADVTARVRKNLPRIERDIVQALSTIQDPHRPGACLCDMGTRGQRCPTFSHFHPDVPGGTTVYDLGSVGGKELEEVLARGIVNLVDWPDDIRISPRQRRQIEVLRRGEPHVDRRQVQQFLDRLEYPLHFLDYETFQTAIPMFDGCGPWSQVPFQYSLHIVDADGSTAHKEFLWTEQRQFPVPALVDQVRRDIGPTGTVIVWNKAFEESRNREMAGMIPEAAGFLLGVNARMADLMDIVRKGAWVHPAFNGSSSIKKVLPVIEPGLSYELLDIGDGSLASERWFEAVMGDSGMAGKDRLAVFDALREYCRRDTWAMVRILEHLRGLATVEPGSWTSSLTC